MNLRQNSNILWWWMLYESVLVDPCSEPVFLLGTGADGRSNAGRDAPTGSVVCLGWRSEEGASNGQEGGGEQPDILERQKWSGRRPVLPLKQQSGQIWRQQLSHLTQQQTLCISLFPLETTCASGSCGTTSLWRMTRGLPPDFHLPQFLHWWRVNLYYTLPLCFFWLFRALPVVLLGSLP